jgi:hypothetical protein
MTAEVAAHLRQMADEFEAEGNAALARRFRAFANVYERSVIRRTDDLAADLGFSEDRITRLVMTYQSRVESLEQQVKDQETRLATLERTHQTVREAS